MTGKKENHIKFEEDTRVQQLMRDLIEPLLGTYNDRGEVYTADDLYRVFIIAFSNAPDPGKAILNIHRMADASFGVSFTRDLVKQPVLMELAIRIASSSQFLSDIIVRDPELFRWLTASEALSVNKSRDHFIRELNNQSELFEKSESKLNALRRSYRREVLRIGTRDLIEQASFETTVKEISDLADAIATVVLEIAIHEVSGKYKIKPNSKFAIIGLGKLGGHELNYSSDIDVMFVIDEDEVLHTPTGKKLHAIEFYSAVTDKWISAMTEHSREGSLYRVDARLRPDGESGPLVRSAHGYRTYYETRGELWERQMLIKARPIAGDIDFGTSFVRSLTPFIYPATFFESPRTTIARMKSRIEERSDDPNNIKLRRGGIRDIEFIVQALQLINGGRDKTIRTGSTLDAIDLLAEKNYLSDDERSTLRNAYIFYRRIEHQVQLDENIQTHSIPADKATRSVFARKLSFNTPGEFDTVLTDTLRLVENIFDGVFSVQKEQNDVHALFTDSDVSMKINMRDYGFVDEKQARDLFKQLAYGTTSFGIGEYDQQTREIFREIAPLLLQNFSSTINPDRALINFMGITREHPHPHSLFVLLKNDAIREALIRLCGFSTSLSLQLARQPEDLELLFSNASEIFNVDDILSTKCAGYSDRLLNLIAHLRFSNYKSTLDEVHRVISHIAIRRIRLLLQEICKDRNLDNPPVAIVSLGKLSGDELGPGADLDLIFIFEEGDSIDGLLSESIAREIIKRAALKDESSMAFEVDMRLRPEGASAPLAVEFNSYREYLEKRVSLWERQSLVRARMIAGNDEFCNRVESLMNEHVYEHPLNDGWVDEIRTMRYRTEKRSRMNRDDYVDFKTGPGGIMDIEFLVQTLQLFFGRNEKIFRCTSTRKVLNILKDRNVLNKKDTEFLARTYEHYRHLEYYNRVYLEDPSNLVPVRDEERRALKKILKLSEDPLQYLKTRSRQTREMFEKLLKTPSIWQNR